MKKLKSTQILADAFLVGESLMKSKNIYKETKYLINK